MQPYPTYVKTSPLLFMGSVVGVELPRFFGHLGDIPVFRLSTFQWGVTDARRSQLGLPV